MHWFLTIFLLLYGGINYYFFRKVHLAWPGNRDVMIVAAFFCLLMVAAPVTVRFLERDGHVRLARLSALVGHNWMALVFWFAIVAALADLWNAGARFAGRWSPGAAGCALTPRASLAVCVLIVLVAAGCALYGASAIRIKTVTFKTPRLAAGSPPIRLVAVTDLHLSLTLGESFTRKVAALVQEARPDIFVSLGDSCDLTFARAKPLADILAGVRAPMGKFAIMGNHEYYGGYRSSMDFLHACGFTVLRGESGEVDGGRLLLAGADDPVARQMGYTSPDEAVILPAGRDRPLTVLLKHRPEVSARTRGRFDLQISGHTHGGQIFPFIFVTYLFNPLGPGLHTFDDGSELYVSRGAGTWGPRMRLFAPPEVTVFVLEGE